MSDYSTSKIYKVLEYQNTKRYIGSTIDTLYKRMNKHKYDYKLYLNSKKGYLTIFGVLDEFGVQNCKIELVEHFACNTREEWHAREGAHQRETKCVNKQVAGRSRAEYRDLH